MPAARRHTAPPTPDAESAAAAVRSAAESILADAADRAADVLALAEDRALAVLERAAQSAGRDMATAGQWAEEAEQLHADVAADAEAVTQRADRTVRRIIDTAHGQADQIRLAAHRAARGWREQADTDAHAAADRLLEEATSRAAGVLAEAEDMAEQIRVQARNRAAEIVAATEQEAGEQARAVHRRAQHDLADVNEQLQDATAKLERTRTRVERYQAEAETELAGRRALADQACRDALTSADAARAEAADDAEQIRTAAASKAREILQQAELTAAEARREAEELCERLEESARTDADGIREDAQAQAQRTVEEAGAEALELLEDGARRAADLRERGQEAGRRLREDAEQVIAEQSRLAKAARGRAESEAERIVNVAEGQAAKLTANAHKSVRDAEAKVCEVEDRLAALGAEQARREAAEAARRQGRIRKVWRWWQRMIPKLLPRLALWAGVAYTATGEHALAVMAGVDTTLAWLLAVCVDVWVVSATRARARREIVVALSVMLFCQIAALLAELHLLGVEPDAHGQWRVQWGLAVPLAMVVPVVIWRVHALMGHGDDAHDEHPAPTTAPGALTDATIGAHEDTGPRPPHGGHRAPSAHDTPLAGPSAHGARSSEREIIAAHGTGGAHRALPAGTGAHGDAHDQAPLSDAALMYARKALVRPLYDALGRRPRAAEIHVALTERGLLTGTPEQTRSTCQRVRDAIEVDEPALKPAVRSA